MAKQHIKPTKEELEEGIKKAQEEAEREETPETPEPEAETPEEEVPSEEQEEQEEPETPEAEPEKEEEEPEIEPEKEETPDYKKKFSESSREAQKIHAKNRKLNEAISEAGNIDDPSEEELQKEYSDWDILSDFEKKLAREALISSRRFNMISKAAEEGKKIDKWNEDVDKFVEDPANLITYPDLEGKQDDFRLFANKEKYNSVPFDVLVPAFLHESQKTTKAPNKGKMFERGTGGPNEGRDKNAGKITVEEAANLMKTNYNKYKELLTAGKILPVE